MAQLVKRAERRINFYRVVSAQDLAHDRKRQLAQQVAGGAAPTAEFEKAAGLEGKTAQDLAALILAKPDVMMERENARRALIVQVRAAKTPADVTAILDANNIGKLPENQQEMI
jgi:hypothetical protein